MNNSSPFLKYVGGKRWFVSKHRDLLPNYINNYYEPFLGSGAIYFHLMNKNLINGNINLNDLNNHLINAYINVKSNPTEIIRGLKKLKNTRSEFEKIKRTKACLNLNGAVRYLYLNKTAFGGIYRVNNAGQFNVPYSKRKYKTFVNEKVILGCSRLLEKANLTDLSFDELNFENNSEDLIVFDPPYIDLESKFNRYNIRKFNLNDFDLLLNQIRSLDDSNCKFLLFIGSNKSIAEKFSHCGNIIKLKRSSNLSPQNSKIKIEYIVKNY